MKTLTRRRFLHLTAMTGVAAALPFSVLGAKSRNIYHWRGIVLGADASMQIYLPEKHQAALLVQRCLEEIRRLESIFSLYDPRSSLSVLNRQGYLDEPPREMVELLNESSRFGLLTDGAFDVTIQPLWKLYAAHFSKNPATSEGPPPAAIEAALKLVDYKKMIITPQRIGFDVPGMQVTLNGIAQGYITDRITALLKAEGMEHTLVEMGEMRALGTHMDGRPWKVGVKNPRQPENLAFVTPLADQALATSAGYGTRFNDAIHHLFNPHTGQTPNHFASVSVIAPSATTADALSTGIFALPPAKTETLIRSLPGTTALIVSSDGAHIRYRHGHP